MYIINGKYWSSSLPDLGPKDSYFDVTQMLGTLTPEMLVKLRAAINGKISKRKIDPAQQAKMQSARKRKVI